MKDLLFKIAMTMLLFLYPFFVAFSALGIHLFKF